jgi:quinol monooxygenase YgiN
MANQIQYAVTWTIHEGKLEEFKTLAAEASALVESNEPDMLGYHWYLNADEMECTLIEQFQAPSTSLSTSGMSAQRSASCSKYQA